MATQHTPFRPIEGEPRGGHVRTGFMAWVLGVTERHLQRWAEHGCPQEERGWWNPQAVVAWRLRTSADKIGDAGDALETRKLTADADYREIRTETARLHKDILAGKFLSTEEVEFEWARRVTEIRSGLTMLGRKIAVQFADPEVRRTVERVIARETRDMCEQYNRTGEYTPTRVPRARKYTEVVEPCQPSNESLSPSS